MIYIGFIYGCILFCSMKDKRSTKHLAFQLVVLCVIVPHHCSPLKGKEQRLDFWRYNSGYETVKANLKRNLNRIILKSAYYYFSISNSGTKMRKKSFSLYPEMSQPL